MLRQFLDRQLAATEKGKPLARLRPLVEAVDTFLYEAPVQTKQAPHIRDAFDIKRMMILVVFALIPCIFMAIWNTGLQSFVYSSGDFHLMNEYLKDAHSFSGYFDFISKDHRYLTILGTGLSIFLPVLFISYLIGGLCEGLFAVLRGHEISEGLLVTGVLFALILPPTIPYWMVAVGVAIGIILGKEVFGGSGMNIVNPALVCRAFLYFAFPGRMSGDVWVGHNPHIIRSSLLKMNQEAGLNPLDGYSQATWLAHFKAPIEVKNIHVDAIASNMVGSPIKASPVVQERLAMWADATQQGTTLSTLNPEQLKLFVTQPIAEGGLGMPPNVYEEAYKFTSLKYGLSHNSDWTLFFGDRLGSMGETSVFCCCLGALLLLVTRIASWRTMLGMLFGAFGTAFLFEWGAKWLGSEGGAWTPAIYSFPAYKHLLLGGLPFGLVFMITDPVSSPTFPLARWLYGAFAGMVTIIIRIINPAYPEGVMLAILMANVFAPLLDRVAMRRTIDKRKFQRVRT